MHRTGKPFHFIADVQKSFAFVYPFETNKCGMRLNGNGHNLFCWIIRWIFAEQTYLQRIIAVHK